MSRFLFAVQRKLAISHFMNGQIACFGRILCVFVLDKGFNDVQTTLIVVLFLSSIPTISSMLNKILGIFIIIIKPFTFLADAISNFY